MKLLHSNHKTSCSQHQTKEQGEISKQQSKSDKEIRLYNKWVKIKANRVLQFVPLSKELNPNFKFMLWEHLKDIPLNRSEMKLNSEELKGITIHLVKNNKLVQKY